MSRPAGPPQIGQAVFGTPRRGAAATHLSGELDILGEQDGQLVSGDVTLPWTGQ